MVSAAWNSSKIPLQSRWCNIFQSRQAIGQKQAIVSLNNLGKIVNTTQFHSCGVHIKLSALLVPCKITKCQNVLKKGDKNGYLKYFK